MHTPNKIHFPLSEHLDWVIYHIANYRDYAAPPPTLFEVNMLLLNKVGNAVHHSELALRQVEECSEFVTDNTWWR